MSTAPIKHLNLAEGDYRDGVRDYVRSRFDQELRTLGVRTSDVTVGGTLADLFVRVTVVPQIALSSINQFALEVSDELLAAGYTAIVYVQ